MQGSLSGISERSLVGSKFSLTGGSTGLIVMSVFKSNQHSNLLQSEKPVLAIGGMQEVVGQELAINVLTLGSICSWIWMITDAFDYTDICQSFKYQ